ncbi:carboxypeptidase B-like [Epargyreus clarus]|uniref:carboxypeptidase B-like n=1 Tax=Epargyreus clarus TaxID=520877 RepID=UPI003C2E83F7
MKGFLLVLLAAVAYAKHEEYIGLKSYYVSPSSMDQVKVLSAMVPQFDLDFISKIRLNHQGVVLVKPHYQAGFSKALAEKNIHFKVSTVDVKTQLDIDDARMEKQKAARTNETMSYDNYQTIEVIDKYLQDIAEEFSDIATLVVPAESFEGHPIQYLKISSTNFEDSSKPIIFINSGMNAREWIGPPTVTYAIHKLVEEITEGEEDLLEKFDWILLPVVNPDGYKYTSRRFWHKNRSTNQHPLSRLCPGVDIDMNFDFFWNNFGTSENPCNDNFPGGEAFSEVETRVVRDILLQYQRRITLYMSMHSYGSYVLYPWGHDGSLSAGAFALHTVGINIVDAIHEKALENFRRYVVGNSVLVTNTQTSGSSEDYAHDLGIPLTYDIELPGLDLGLEGFHLAPEYIQQVVEETWAGIVVGARRSGELFG